MNLNGYRDWLAGVNRHYGSLDGFDDARTVQIMLENIEREISEDARIREDIRGKAGKAEWDEAFAEERKYAVAQRAALKDWLAARGLQS